MALPRQEHGLLMIPENEYFDAKIFLASQGIPRSAQGGGFDELLANDSMTRSRNMEAAQLKEFDERELKETIEAIYAVKRQKFRSLGHNKAYSLKTVNQPKPLFMWSPMADE